LRTQHARAVVLAAYTYENLRLMFLSPDDRHPDGLGNSSGQLGRHYTTKMFAHVNGCSPESTSIATPGQQHKASSLMTSSRRTSTPSITASWVAPHWAPNNNSSPLQISRECLPPDMRPWGKPYRDHILGWQHLGVVRIQPDALPYADHFVDIDPRHRDRSGVGMPQPRITFRLHENEVRLAAWMGERAAEILKEMGATKTWEGPHFTGVGSSHEFGVTRMGEDPVASVVDPWLQVHDTPNLHVYGGSVFPSCPGINPTLRAVVLRAAEKLARDLAGRRP
jgi:gluconate 2-dehydrogenase alpha chain